MRKAINGLHFPIFFSDVVIMKFSPNLVRLDGHITASHKLAKIRKLNEDISFNAVRNVSVNIDKSTCRL